MNSVEYIKQFPVRSFSRGTIIIQKGDPLTFLMAIRTGYVKITSISDAGIERLIWVAGRYDLAPLEQLFTKQASAQFFYTALTDGSYYEVDRIKILDYAKEHPDFMTEIARGMSEHYDDFLQRVDAMDGLSVRERLLRTLHYLARRFSAGDTVNLHEEGLRITHSDLSAMIGSTRETTSVELARLRKEALIEYNRSCFIIHTRAIEALGD
jgi:CRP-like cAMP-binding protein